MGDESLTTFLLATFAIGIGIGSLACEKLSRNQIELGITPIGAIGLSLFTLDLYFFSSNLNIVTPMNIKLFLSHLSNWRLILDLIMIGTFGGIFSVPFYAAIQEQAEKKFLSRIIAANNIINAIFMVSASLLAISILSLGVSIPEFFALISVLNIFLMIIMHFNSKIFLERFLCILKN